MHYSFIIYKFLVNDKIYVGSTYDYDLRMNSHKSKLKTSKNKLYNYINECKLNFNSINIDIYSTLTPNGFNFIKAPFDKFAYYQKYRIRKKKSKAEQKQYNREKSLLFYNNNREKILEKNRLKIHCECGCYVVNNQLKRHKNTMKHKYLMLTNNNVIL